MANGTSNAENIIVAIVRLAKCPLPFLHGQFYFAEVLAPPKLLPRAVGFLLREYIRNHRPRQEPGRFCLNRKLIFNHSALGAVRRPSLISETSIFLLGEGENAKASARRTRRKRAESAENFMPWVLNKRRK
jgi:hypothetical protein